MEDNRRIKNYKELAKTKYHKDALDIIEAGYDAIDTDKAIKENVKISGGILTVKEHSFDLKKYKNIYIVGCGKIVCQAASSIEDLLKGFITEGAVVGIKNKVCENINTYEGTHPLPSDVNFKATKDIIQVGQKADEDDLVIAIVGGGGSALLCSSIEEWSQGEKLYKAFLDSGGTISELNMVRRHLSKLKGGGLAKVLYPATVLSLIFSDVPGENCRVVASGPTFRDVTTVKDAQDIIDKYNLGEFKLEETPKLNDYFKRVYNTLLVSNHNPIEKMLKKATELGYDAVEVGCDVYDFPEKISERLQKMAHANSVLVMGGETRLIVPENCKGKGGRNDYLALSMINNLKDNQIFSSFASDGHDNTDAAGGLVDGETKKQMEELGIDVPKHLKELDSYPALLKSNNLIFTGYIEANVSDLMLLLTHKKEDE